MAGRQVLTRENTFTDELQRSVEKEFKGIHIKYDEVYYLDYEVDEETGMINRQVLVEHYTKEQTARNLKAMKSAYLVEKGAASPAEIINFRKKYNIAASVLSLILGFSKNTISNIENEGITSLPSGRFIRLVLKDRSLLAEYVRYCTTLEEKKKKELLEKLLV